MSDEVDYGLKIDDGRASHTSVCYSPYFALRPHEVMRQALDLFEFALNEKGLRPVGSVTFTQLDNPQEKTEHAFEKGWVTGPWYHQYTISAPVRQRDPS